MSSISSSERARNTDEVRQAREDYENREAENVKKTKKELQRLEKKHSENLNKIKENYDDQVSAIREKSRDTLTKRDEDHLQQVEKVRNMYQQQLKKKAEDFDTTRKAMESARNSDQDKRERITNQQVDTLTRNQRDELLERDRQFADFSERSRKELQDALAERTEKLNAKHAQELEAASGERVENTAQREKVISDMKSAYNNRLKESDRNHRLEKDRLNDHWRDVVRNQEETNNAIIDNRSEALKSERADIKSRFENKLQGKVDEMDQMRNQLHDDVTDRYESQLRAAKNSEQRAKARTLQENLTQNRMRKLERNHLVQQYEDRMQDLARQHDEIKDASKDLIHSRVNQVVEKGDHVLQETNRRHRMDKSLSDTRNREDRAILQEQNQSRLDETRARAEGQVKNIMKASRKQQVTQQSQHNQNLDQLKENYSEHLAAQRNAHLEGLTELRGDMESRLHEQEAKSQKRQEYLVESYETKIKQMDEAHKAELEQLKKGFAERSQQQQQAHQMDEKAIQQKYEIKFNAQQEEHQREMERQQKRNDEKVADVAAKVAYYRKKA